MSVESALRVAAKFKPHNLVQQEKEQASGIVPTANPKRIMVQGQGPGGVKGIVVPKHMWEGGGNVPGMREINEARAKVYGAGNRDPLTVGKIGEIHKQVLDDHFRKPLKQQLADEMEALERLREAKHISRGADTLDESEKLDTVHHERDAKGRTYVAYGSKGTAGHAVYTSGTGDNMKFHILNTCPGQTGGCGGGVHNGVVDTSKGTCFAPTAESQYPGAAVRRAAHAQAKHDPAMTKDWILAHAGSLRRAAERADKQNKVTLFRPNVVDESDRSTRHVIRHLNKQRKADGKPGIIANSYGKTTELHDPDNGYFVTYSNTGPKTKLGQSVAENIARDKMRVRQTITAADAAGNDFRNDDGKATPPKNSYMVTDVKRYSDMDKRMQKAFKYAKYWSTGRPVSSLSPKELEEGNEGHYDGQGNPTTPDKAHYGHLIYNGSRYDYQKQHILHPRMVQVGKNKDGSPHVIPTDSRFKDDEFLPKDRFMTKNGKKAGAILLTTPTTSTSNAGHQTSFTHHVDDAHIDHALKNNGEYEIDHPSHQEAAAGREYKQPTVEKRGYATGGHVHARMADDGLEFPERDETAMLHLMHRGDDTGETGMPAAFKSGGAVDKALKVVGRKYGGR